MDDVITILKKFFLYLKEMEVLEPGLRSGDLASIRLTDIHWRKNEIWNAAPAII